MKLFSRFVLLLLLLCGGCGKGKYTLTLNTEYYEHANDLYKRAAASPKNIKPIDQLVTETGSPDLWRRHYAVGFLGLLYRDMSLDTVQQTRIIEVLHKAISDSDHGNKRQAVELVMEIGNDAVLASLSELIQLVEARQENDFNWFAAEALGKIRSKPEAAKALPVLLRVACEPKTTSYPPGTPELRIEAAMALLELIEANQLPARDTLLQLKAHPPSLNLADKIEALLKATPSSAAPFEPQAPPSK